MKNFRKPYLSIIIAAIFLFVSCSKYDIETQNINAYHKFDSNLLNSYKENLTLFNSTLIEISNLRNGKLSNNTLDTQNEIINIINNNFNTTLEVNANFFELSLLDSEEILNTSLKNSWITEVDIVLINSLIKNIELNGFKKAVESYKSEVHLLNLSDEDFAKKNNFINTLEIINFNNPNYFKINSGNFSKQGPIWECVKATISVVASLVGFAGCATIILCALSIAAFAISFDNFMEKCVGTYLSGELFKN